MKCPCLLYTSKYWGGGGFTKSGIPDLIVCDRGVFMGIEVKAEGGSPSLLQLKHLSMIQEAGGYGILPVSYTHLDVYKRQISP